MRLRFAVLLLAVLVTSYGYLRVTPAHAQVPVDGKLQTSCFKRNADPAAQTVCVPLSVLQAVFSDYHDGDPAPTHALRQALINVQSELAETLRRQRECEGQLGPLAAKSHSEALTQQQTALDKALASAAPPDTVWDVEKQRYVPKSAKPATAGRGGGL